MRQDNTIAVIPAHLPPCFSPTGTAAPATATGGGVALAEARARLVMGPIMRIRTPRSTRRWLSRGPRIRRARRGGRIIAFRHAEFPYPATAPLSNLTNAQRRGGTRHIRGRPLAV